MRPNKHVDEDSSPTSTNGIECLPEDIVVTVESHNFPIHDDNDVIQPLNELDVNPLNFDRALRPTNGSKLSGGESGGVDVPTVKVKYNKETEGINVVDEQMT